MKTNDNERKIRQLIEKFMTGGTSLNEEQEIGKWLRETELPPEDLRPYKQMFEYFDEGMPLPEETTPKHHTLRYIHWLAAACVAAIVGLTIWMIPSEDSPTVAQSYVPEEKQQPLPKNDSIQTTEAKKDSTRQQKTPSRRKRHHHMRSLPEPPAVYLAEARLDSMIWENERKTDELIAKTRQEEERLIDSLYTVCRQYELQIIAMSLDDVEEVIEE